MYWFVSTIEFNYAQNLYLNFYHQGRSFWFPLFFWRIISKIYLPFQFECRPGNLKFTKMQLIIFFLNFKNRSPENLWLDFFHQASYQQIFDLVPSLFWQPKIDKIANFTDYWNYFYFCKSLVGVIDQSSPIAIYFGQILELAFIRLFNLSQHIPEVRKEWSAQLELILGFAWSDNALVSKFCFFFKSKPNFEPSYLQT